MKFKHSKKLIIAVFVIAMTMIFIVWQNNDIVTSQIEYRSSKLPLEFDGYKVAHISDLHNKKFGKDQEPLLKELRKASPDIIVVTGDLIDRRRYNLETSMIFINGAVEIAPVYYVAGNHEAWSGEYRDIKSRLIEAGVEILDDRKIEIKKGDSRIEILGLSDPAFLTNNQRKGTDSSSLERNLKDLADNSVFQILLSHRPELFNIYADENIDLTFSGHAHGGQIRTPFIGGLVAPGQGIFPEYTQGIHKKDKSSLVVSRGLGNSLFPIRIFNRPEVVLVTFKNE